MPQKRIGVSSTTFTYPPANATEFGEIMHWFGL